MTELEDEDNIQRAKNLVDRWKMGENTATCPRMVYGNLYLAAPLFTAAEQCFNRRLKQALEQRTDAGPILPQEQAPEADDREADWAEKTRRWCLEEIEKADLVLAILDGPDADSGTCVGIECAPCTWERARRMRDLEDRS